MFFDKLYQMIERIEREIKEAIAANGAMERRHNAEIARLLDQHGRETDALKQQIVSLTDLNERLLRQCGLDPINNASQEASTVQQNSAPSPEPVTTSARLIQRDQKRVYGLSEVPMTPERQAYLERVASEIATQRSASASE